MGELKKFDIGDLVVCNKCGVTMPQMLTDFHSCGDEPVLAPETDEEEFEVIEDPADIVADRLHRYALYGAAVVQLLNTLLLMVITGLLIAIVSR